MTEEFFIQKNITKWRRLEAFNFRLSRKGAASMNKADIRGFAELYRSAGHDLAYARTHFGSGKTALYLNQLVGGAHIYFYTREKFSAREVLRYLKTGFPSLVRTRRQYTAAALLSFLLGFGAAFALILADPKFAGFFFSPEQLGGGSASSGSVSWDYPSISSFLMVNNIRVALTAAAFGLLAGAGTLFILFYNGMVIGSLTCYFFQSGQDMLKYWSLILPHGFLELTAIFISGGAGLILGRALLMPGNMTRKDSVISGGREVAALLPGVALMLVIAAVIEGFFTPMAVSPIIKLAFAALTLVGIVFYFRRASLKPTLQPKDSLAGAATGS